MLFNVKRWFGREADSARSVHLQGDSRERTGVGMGVGRGVHVLLCVGVGPC